MGINPVISFTQNISASRFKENRDRLSKAVENDKKLISWICWCLNLKFEDFNYKQMYEFIGKVTNKDLENSIKKIESHIFSEDQEGIFLDNFFYILDNSKVTGLLGIENQTSIPSYEEIEARGIYYECTLIYSEKPNIVSSTTYRDLVAPVDLWIFPSGPNFRKNSIVCFPLLLPGKVKIEDMTTLNPPQSYESKFKLKPFIYQVYLGNPLKISKERLEKEEKSAFLNLLLDIVFNFETEKEVRLDLIEKYFNIKNIEVIEIMTAFEAFRNTYIQEGITKGITEGITEGIAIGETNCLKKSIQKLANHLIHQSNNQITMEQALKEAKEILDTPD